MLTSHAFVHAEKTTPPSVVVTIKPIYGLVAALLNGITTPTLLAEGRGSAHTLSLAPRDVKILSSANIVIWVGESYEMMMAKPLKKAIPSNILITLEQIPTLKLYPQRTNGLFAGHSCQCCHHEHDSKTQHIDHTPRDEHIHLPTPIYNDEREKETTEHHHHTSIDGHFWLDIDNAKLCAHAISEKLIQLCPHQKDAILGNFHKLTTELDALKIEIANQLLSIQNKTALIDHDSLQYMEKQFNFNIRGVLSAEAGMEPSPRHITALKEELGANLGEGLIKVFFYSGVEHAPASKLVTNLTKQYSIRIAPIDYVGDAVQKGIDSYQNCLKAISAQLIRGFEIKA